MTAATPRADAALAPLLAGAHARGLYDAFELLGQGAILLDRQGRALAATTAARQAFGATLALEDGRLVSPDPTDDARLRGVIHDSLAGLASDVEIGRKAARMTLRLTPIPRDPNQLLAAIALIDPPCAGREAPNFSRIAADWRAAATH